MLLNILSQPPVLPERVIPILKALKRYDIAIYCSYLKYSATSSIISKLTSSRPVKQFLNVATLTSSRLICNA